MTVTLVGLLIHTIPSPTRSAGPFELTLEQGQHSVSLRGITAPDAVGTYYISFSGDINVLSGAALSGDDLTAGVQKSWTINVLAPSTTSARAFKEVQVEASVPIIWNE